MADEITLIGGRSTAGVVRVGDIVHRPQRPNAPFVHALLRHLEDVAFDGAPRWLGIDALGREKLTFIAGDVPLDLGWWNDEQLVAAAKLIRRYHNATINTPLAGDEELVCHNDLSPCNTVFVGGFPIALIDFDAAKPGPRLCDVSYAAWLWLDIGNDDILAQEQERRLRLFCAAYADVAVADVVDAIILRQAQLAEEVAVNHDFTEERRIASAEWAWRCRDWILRHQKALEKTN